MTKHHMTSPAHTPAKVSHSALGELSTVRHSWGVDIVDSHGDLLATVPFDGTGYEESHAALFAAAPDLLQALIRTVRRLEHHLCDVETCDLESADDLTLEQARCAIYNAQGVFP